MFPETKSKFPDGAYFKFFIIYVDFPLNNHITKQINKDGKTCRLDSAMAASKIRFDLEKLPSLIMSSRLLGKSVFEEQIVFPSRQVFVAVSVLFLCVRLEIYQKFIQFLLNFF